MGSWSEPVDLDLNSESLKGVGIKVRCLTSSKEDQSSNEYCLKLGEALQALGAVLSPRGDSSQSEVKPNEHNLDANSNSLISAQPLNLVVTIQNQDSNTGLCGWSLVPMILTFSLFPCEATSDSIAKLTIADVDTGLASSWPLKIHLKRYVGAGALILLGLDGLKPIPRSKYHEEIMRRFAIFVQSKTYSAAMKQSRPL